VALIEKEKEVRIDIIMSEGDGIQITQMNTKNKICCHIIKTNVQNEPNSKAQQYKNCKEASLELSNKGYE